MYVLCGDDKLIGDKIQSIKFYFTWHYLFLFLSSKISRNEVYDFKQSKIESKINDVMETKIMSTTFIIIIDLINI